MRRMMFLVASVIALSGAAQAQSKESRGKILIAYFSWGGNTREMARQIQQQTGGDLFEITTVKSYPKDYNECTEVAKKEQQANARPPLAAEVKDMAAYDTVFVGYPERCRRRCLPFWKSTTSAARPSFRSVRTAADAGSAVWTI
jgi:hypothetical protein